MSGFPQNLFKNMPSSNPKKLSILLTKLQKLSIVNDCKDEFTTASNPMIIPNRMEWKVEDYLLVL